MVQRKYRQSSSKNRAGQSPGQKSGKSNGIFWNIGVGLLILINLAFLGSAAYKFAFKEKSPKILHRTPVHEKLPVTQKPQAAKRIRVELLNGCGVQGLAMSFSRYLRQHGFDVVETRNYSSFNVKRTLVIDRTSLRLKNAIKVADVLHVSRKFIQPKLNPDLQVEVTVVLGNDFTKLKGFDQIGKD